MANLRDIRRRIKSVKNTAQITRAMQLVAAAKMKKAQDQALASALKAKQLSQSRHAELKREMDSIKAEMQSVDMQNKGDAFGAPDPKADAAKEARLKELGEAFASLAKAKNCDFLSLFGTLPDSTLLKDGVHPDAAGNAALAREILPRLDPRGNARE